MINELFKYFSRTTISLGILKFAQQIISHVMYLFTLTQS